MTTTQAPELSEIATVSPDTPPPPDGRPLTPSERILANNQMLEVIGPVIQRDHVIAHHGSTYVKVAGGIAIANALGFTISTTKPIYTEDVEGKYYESTAQLLDNGRVIAEAVGYLGMDESRWATEPIYSKRSMAQTRAVARLCRQNFAHFYISIGASDTAWEEIPEQKASPKKVSTPAKKNARLKEGQFKITSCILRKEGESANGKWYIHRVTTVEGYEYDSFNVNSQDMQTAIENDLYVQVKQVEQNEYGTQAKYIDIVKDDIVQPPTDNQPPADDIPF